MKKFFQFFARFIAVICAILFVVTAIVALLLFNLERRLFNANTYKTIFTENRIYEQLPILVGDMLATSMSFNPCEQNPLICENNTPELNACYKQTLGEAKYKSLANGDEQPTEAEIQQLLACQSQFGGATGATATDNQGGMPPFMRNLSAENWASIIRSLLPSQDLKIMTESVLEQLFAYTNGETDSVRISLVQLKTQMTSMAGVNAVIQLLKSQPDCTEADIAQFLSGGSNSEIVFCNPPETAINFVIPLAQAELTMAASKIPDEAVIIKPLAPGSPAPGSGPFGADPIATIRLVRLIMLLSPLLPIVCLLLITLFGVRSLKSWLRWWGIPLLIFACLGFLIGILINPALRLVWAEFVRFPVYISPGLGDSAFQLAGSLLHSVSEPIVLETLIFGLLALGAVIGSTFIHPKTEPTVTPQPS